MLTKVSRRIRSKVETYFGLAGAAASTDAFLASYPKSGRTWFRFILANYFAAAAKLDIDVSLHNMFAVLPNFDFDPVRGLPAFGFGGQPGVPLISVSHRPYEQLLFRRRPVVFMVRDPRDVLVSAYFHATRHKHRFSGGMHDFLNDPSQGLPALLRYLNGWAAGLTRHRHHLLSYERLSADPAGSTAQVLTFLGVGIDHGALARAIELSHFETMRDRERREGIPAHDYDRSDGESLRMRRGKAGGYIDYLSDGEIALIEAACTAKLTPAAKELVAATGTRLG